MLFKEGRKRGEGSLDGRKGCEMIGRNPQRLLHRK
jgi:hypothetical protein